MKKLNGKGNTITRFVNVDIKEKNIDKQCHGEQNVFTVDAVILERGRGPMNNLYPHKESCKCDACLKWEESHYYAQLKGDNTQPRGCTHCGEQGTLIKTESGWRCKDCYATINGNSYYQGRNSGRMEILKLLKTRRIG